MGHDTVDGDDAYRLKVTLANGDIIYYFLDPDTYLEIRTEKTQFIRGSVRETFTDLGSYKQVAGVYFPFSIESGQKRSPGDAVKITFDKIEANTPRGRAAIQDAAHGPRGWARGALRYEDSNLSGLAIGRARCFGGADGANAGSI